MQRHQSSTEVVTLLEQLRESAANAVCTAFPNNLKAVESVPGFHRFLLTRARNGDYSSPLLRLAGWFVALSQHDRLEHAQLLVDWLQSVVDRLGSADSVLNEVHLLSLAEQREEAFETLSRTEYETAAPAERARICARWIEQLRRENAIQARLIRALEQEHISAGRAAAA